MGMGVGNPHHPHRHTLSGFWGWPKKVCYNKVNINLAQSLWPTKGRGLLVKKMGEG